MFRSIVTRAAGIIPAKVAACLLLLGVSLAIAAPASAAGSSTAATAVTAASKPSMSSLAPNGIVNAATTGWSAASKTSMSFCNGQLYVAFTQADRRIVVLWNWNGTVFTGHVKYLDTSIEPQAGYYAAPALACWKPASGTWSDRTRLWIAFTGTDKKLYYGFHEDSDVNDQRIEPYISH